jgi:probable HAF family extracellular repeat protein
VRAKEANAFLLDGVKSMDSRILIRFLTGLAAIVLLGGAPSRSLADPLYSVTDLGSGNWTLLNNSGQVAGGGYTTSHTLGSYTQVYNSNTGQVTVIGMTPPSSSGPGSYNFGSYPIGLSDNGQLALGGVGGNMLSYELYNNGNTTSLPVYPLAVNNAGQVLMDGISSQQSGSYVLTGGSAQPVGLLPGANGVYATAINNSGELTGESGYFSTSSSGADTQQWQHAFLYNGSTTVDLGSLGGFAMGTALNNKGDVVGFSNLTPESSGIPNQIIHAFLAPAGGKMIDLGTLPGDPSSEAFSVNDKDQVVGWSGPANEQPVVGSTPPAGSHAFLYQNGVMTNLNSLIPPIGITLTMGIAINDQGQILATGVDANGNPEQVLLTPAGDPVPPSPVYPEAPVPEPSTLAVLAAGAIGFAVKRARTRLKHRDRSQASPRTGRPRTS